jgi:Heparinase II/III-like protein/Heparinase II/III N-terminus
MNIAWYIKRLAAMSPSEIIHRSLFWIKKNNWRNKANNRLLFQNCTPVCEHSKRAHGSIAEYISSNTIQALISEANGYLEHTWNFFNLHNAIEPTIDWHFDPSTHKYAPQKYSFDINHRKTELIGDAKILWEKSRHHHLTILSIAYAYTKNERYAQEVAIQILDWIEKNPCLIGINWTHPLELGIRLISWVWCERFLQGSIHYSTIFGPQSPIWLSIGQHQEVIEQTYSTGSSANNHLIGEMAGLFIASTAFPIYKKSIKWRHLAMKILESEIVKQTYTSGINKEMAFEYQLFVVEFLLLSLYEAQKSNSTFSDNYSSILYKMLVAIIQLSDYGKELPHYGDGDDGMAIQLQSRNHNRLDWILQLGSILLNKSLGCNHIPTLPVRLMGFNELPSQEPIDQKVSIAFKDAGIYVLSNKRNTPEELFIIADAGPLGYLSLAAHGHADALSFTMSAGGKMLFCDPGTYNYYTEAKWRNYFRSTRAHNTILIDSLDQSKLQGMFLWSHKATTTVEKWETDNNRSGLTASHNGYLKNIGVTHKRTFSLNENTFWIIDELIGNEEHTISLIFHCHPQCTVQQENSNCLQIVNNNKKAVLRLPEHLKISLHKAEDSAGWYSPQFGIKEPSVTIIAEAHCKLPLILSTEIEVIHEG